jgi:hypothetical protein
MYGSSADVDVFGSICMRLGIYTCVNVCACVWMHLCVCACVDAYVDADGCLVYVAYVNVCVDLHVCICMCVRMDMYGWVVVCTWMCMRLGVWLRASVSVYTSA